MFVCFILGVRASFVKKKLAHSFLENTISQNLWKVNLVDKKNKNRKQKIGSKKQEIQNRKYKIGSTKQEIQNRKYEIEKKVYLLKS